MQVLIVDDSAVKATDVLQVIEAAVPGGGIISGTVSASMSEVVKTLASKRFDLIVLDLMVPYIPGGKVDSTAGLELLRQVRAPEALSRNAVVIGLSAFPDEASSVRAEFDRHAVVLLTYDRSGTWKAPIARAVQDSLSLTSGRAELDFVVLVALPEEAAPYDNLSVDLTTRSIVHGLNVQLLTLRSNGARGALIRLRQMGLVAAAIDTATAIAAFSPKVLAMSGICAGFGDRTVLGQLIVPSPAWEYQAGKWSADGFLLAPDQVHVRPSTRVILDQLLERSNLISDLERQIAMPGNRPGKVTDPTIAPGATGSAVIAAKERLEHIEKQHRKISVLDMETYGVYKAAYEADHFVEYFFVAKVVVDLADRGKSDELHSYGSSISAAFCLMAIEEILNKSK